MGDFISRGFRHAGRYRKIVAVLARYGFEDFLSSIRAYKYLPGTRLFFSRKRYDHIIHLTRWERVRLALEELGPTFVKLGQIASNRPDLLPLPLIKELEKLQDEAPPFPAESVKAIVEEELQCSINDKFDDFCEEPLASASIAQVHMANLKGGEKVVLKVQRPNIEEQINTDVEIMYSLAGLMERYSSEMRFYHPVNVVESFDRTIRKEMDFLNEASNIERFRVDFEEDKTIRVPEVYHEFTTQNVLTMGRVEGVKVSHLYDEEYEGYNKKLIAERIVNHFFRQVFMNGFFHADPHPGNVFVQEDNVICYLDFGMMGMLTPLAREQLVQIFIGVQSRDTRRIVQALRKLSTESKIENSIQLEEDIARLIEDYTHRSIENIRVEETINEFRSLIIKYQLHVPPDFFLLLKANVALEGMVLKLDPNIKPIEHLKPYVKHIFRERMKLSKLLKKLNLSLMDFSGFIQDIPTDFRDIVEQIKAGKIRIDMEHSGLIPVTSAIEHVSNRIAVAIVLAALIIGSSMLVLADIPPRYYNVPIFGIVGYLIAAVLGFWLIVNILRKGDL